MRKKVLATLAVTCSLLGSSLTALAVQSVPEPEDVKCTLTVSYVMEDMEEGVIVPISGATFEATKVACLDWQGGSPEYVLTEAFKDTNIVFDGMTASESREAAKTVSKVLTLSEQAAVTEMDGDAVFENLEPGIYLIQETNKTGVSIRYSEAEPFFAKVPDYQNGNWVYDVVTAPKSVPVETLDPGKPATVEPSESIKTGDTMNIYLWLGLFLCSVGGLGYVVKAHIKKRE